MKIDFPKKSIFGFKVLNSTHSIITGYLLLSFSKLITPLFGQERIEVIASSLFILLSNTSIIILILNSIIQRSTRKIYPWIFYNLPLWIYVPIIIRKSIEAIRLIINIRFYI